MSKTRVMPWSHLGVNYCSAPNHTNLKSAESRACEHNESQMGCVARWKSRKNRTPSSHPAFLVTGTTSAAASDTNAMPLYLWVAQGGKWRVLPQRFGNCHTIATRINRWSKAGVRDRIVAKRQQAQMLRLRIAAVSRDAIDSKLHPDGTNALKKVNNCLDRPAADGPPNGTETASGCRGCANGRGMWCIARRSA